jgi:hypothetical protein
MKTLLNKNHNVTECSKRSGTPSSRNSEHHDTRSHHMIPDECKASVGAGKPCSCVIDVPAFLQEVSNIYIIIF